MPSGPLRVHSAGPPPCVVASFVGHTLAVSPVTLALLQDTGWYVANFSAADALFLNESFGFKQGCDFATARCLSSTGAGLGTPPHFYGSPRETATGGSLCTTDGLAIAHVSLANYSGNIPAKFRYFAWPRQGGPLLSADFCPTVSAYSNTRCWAPGDASTATREMGMVFGGGSMCLQSTLLWNTL